jgi:hypothetical protein
MKFRTLRTILDFIEDCAYAFWISFQPSGKDVTGETPEEVENGK